MNINLIESQLKQIDFHVNPGNELVTIKWVPPVFHLIGWGTDAVVVQHPDGPDRVFKVFARERLHKKENEYDVYQRIGQSPYFARCFAKGENYLVLSYEEGPTLYQCLEQGIVIPEQVIADVEDARTYARSRGLNPRDIHLKNVLLQNGRAKLIDVSEFLQPGDDGRWDHLVQGYRDFYHLIKGKKIPSWVIELVKKTYYMQVTDEFSVSEFGRRFVQLLGLGKRD
ncbi:serine/threonine protein kinase [Paenactinomyces guangxiensis]|uniref:Serine/threonine protein kinase n=1 Tax=Paenactinomyces guangxiensis TaxID=1490290 RepID=A0A7W1WMT1_9BACL|nr:serine/threonine protein kinase [Paenactinomyces guangxiensis]MBA4492807.1 serine/threonine protein kinase [Paenactinomyces guangxiensis]MBH8590344.1 serine/threonine protein kinase [Paenactinomyces guangxiensis]